MRKLIMIAAVLSAGAIAPALADDQADPNPPTAPGLGLGRQTKPAAAEKPMTAPRTDMKQAAGDTSGPAAGEPVMPPTVVQKENPAAQKYASPEGLAGPSGTAAGSPGIEAKPGTQAGQPPKEVIRKKPAM